MTLSLSAARRIGLVAVLAAGLAACGGIRPDRVTETVVYPLTRTVAQVDTYFGTAVADPYRWLEDDNAADTRAWVAAQNRVTAAHLAAIPFRDAVRERIRRVSDYVKYRDGFTKNGKVYFYRNDGLQNQSVLYVQAGFDGTPEVLLDPNTFSADGTIALTDFAVSRDGRYAAYAKTAIAGSDWREVGVIDLKARRPLADRLQWVRFSGLAWRGDGFYYSRYPQPEPGAELTGRAEYQSVWFHRVGTPQADDTLVYEDRAHPGHFVGVSTTEDERFAVLSIRDRNRRGNGLWVRDDARSEPGFRAVVAEIGESSYEVVDNDGADLLVLTNDAAPRRKLMRVPVGAPAAGGATPTPASMPPRDRWTTLIAERPEQLQHLRAAGGRLFATYLKDVAAQVRVHDRAGRPLAEVALPGPGTVDGFHGDHAATELAYTYTSLTQPPAIYRLDLASGRSRLFRAPEIPGFDPARYESRQVWFTSRDGTRVPMFVVHRKGLPRDGRNPTLLYGYGGFNVTLNPRFSAARIAWLEQGGVFALANLRGGGEYGEAWHEAGMRLAKQNVFDDCIAAAEALIRDGYTASDRLALQGGSNGGLLVGAVVNQRPELFRVALPQVGVMDMLRFQRFSVGAAWVADYGSSDDETQFANLLRYSPIHNVKAGVPYPATLITTADHDDRVVPAHSFKYAATLQAKASGGPLLIRIETQSGHGASNLAKGIAEAADAYAFAWFHMGVVPRFDAR